MATKQIDLRALLEQKTAGIVPAENAKEVIEAAERAVPKNLLFDAQADKFEPETVTTGTELAVRPLSVEETQMFEAKINECIDQIFVEGVHYGSVPGVKKKFIFKAGCEVILSMMGLVARTEVIDKIEDYTNGVFSYTCKTWLIDNAGSVRAEGYGVCNSKENKYLKMNPYNIQNVLIKLSRKRSICDATLSVASLSNKFSQDEDLVEPEQPVGRNPEELRTNNNNATSTGSNDRPASQKQIRFIESLAEQNNITVEALNKYTKSAWNVDDYRRISGKMASALIERIKTC